MLEVRTATRRDVPALGRVLARAFADDPVVRWLLPDGHRRELLFRTLARFSHGPSGCADLAEDGGQAVGASLWDLPTYRPSPWQQVRALPGLAAALRGHLRHGEALERAFLEHRPPGGFWYLAQIGATEPGHGVGSALLAGRLERILGPAYLECTTERAIELYERFGFRVRDEIKLPFDGPVCWTMYREATI